MYYDEEEKMKEDSPIKNMLYMLKVKQIKVYI